MRPRSYLTVLSIVLVALIGFIVWATPGRAAPARLNCSPGNAAISAPAAGATLSGIVQLEGNAFLDSAFQYYKLEFSPEGRDAFTVFGGLVRQPVRGGQLGVWDSASVPDGIYTLRLRVVDTTGNYCEATVGGLQVRNSAPVRASDTPAPTETEGAVPTSVVPTAAPTIQVPTGERTSGEAQATTQPTPNGTPASSSGGGLIPGLNFGGITSALGEVFSGYVRAFLFGIIAMAGLMLVVGVIFYVRRVL